LASHLLTTAVAARRGYGEDSIYWHEPKSRYVGAISLGYDPKGKRIRKSVTGKTKAEVRDKLKELHRELDEGTASSPTYRVDQAVSAWLASTTTAWNKDKTKVLHSHGPPARAG